MFVNVFIKGFNNTENIEEILHEYNCQKEHYDDNKLSTCLIQLDFVSDLWDLQEKLKVDLKLLREEYDILIIEK